MADISEVMRNVERECQGIARTTSFKAISKANIACGIIRTVARTDVLNRKGTGRQYIVRGQLHRASAPNNPPAPITGHLRDSTSAVSKYNKVGNGVTIHIEMKNTAKYAGFLDNGTKNMEPRPFMNTIRDLSEPKIDWLYRQV